MSDEFKIIDKGYGKSWVKLLHIKREGRKHTIREYEVDTRLTLATERDYTQVMSPLRSNDLLRFHFSISINNFRATTQILLLRTARKIQSTFWQRIMESEVQNSLVCCWWNTSSTPTAGWQKPKFISKPLLGQGEHYLKELRKVLQNFQDQDQSPTIVPALLSQMLDTNIRL